MNTVRAEKTDAGLILYLAGRIDSSNAQAAEAEILRLTAGDGNRPAALDAERLAYISSAGLRVILRLKKAYPALKLVNAQPEVYEILEMTGFTEMMEVEKAYRTVSVEGCEVIGEGFNGKVYRLDDDTVVKTYKNADALADIRHEREVARLALILGVPTAISYDVVKVGGSYGSVFELLRAESFSKLLANEPERFDWCVEQYVRMLKKIHGVRVPAGKLPSMKEKTLSVVRRMRARLPETLGNKLLRLVEEIPESDGMIHGDFHTKNIVLADGEVLVIDMDTLSVGHPIFDLMQMYNSYVGFSECDPAVVLAFQGYPAETARRFWRASLSAYLGIGDETALREIENKIRILSYADLIDFTVRFPSDDPEKDEATLAYWTGALTGLLETTDSLLFPVNALTVEAVPESLPAVTEKTS